MHRRMSLSLGIASVLATSPCVRHYPSERERNVVYAMHGNLSKPLASSCALVPGCYAQTSPSSPRPTLHALGEASLPAAERHSGATSRSAGSPRREKVSITSR